MMHTTKMILVPSQMVNKETGVETLLSSLDKEMQNILEDKKIPADAKLMHYMQILHRHQKTSEEQKKPFKIEVQETQPSISKKLNDEQILKGMPQKQMKNAVELLDHVKQNSNIKWSDDNELIVNGAKFPGTNIRDLIHDFSRGRKTQVPVKGADVFARALAKGNIPKSIIGSTFRRELVENEKPLIFGTPSGSLHGTPRNTKELSEHKVKKSGGRRKNGKTSPPLPFNQSWDSVTF